MHYYPALSGDMESSQRPWTQYDEELVSLLFSKIVNRTVLAGGDRPAGVDDVVGNLFDLCLYISKDVHYC